MAQDFGIIVSQPGTSVVGANPAQLTMNTSNPFLKIDTQQPNSFQTVTLLITTDPPEPSLSGGDTYTTLYRFKHGYPYIPTVETLYYVTSPPPGSNFTQTYFQDSGVIGSHVAGSDSAVLYTATDATYVNVICHKNQSGGGSANLLSGTNINITFHVFVENT